MSPALAWTFGCEGRSWLAAWDRDRAERAAAGLCPSCGGLAEPLPDGWRRCVRSPVMFRSREATREDFDNDYRWAVHPDCYWFVIDGQVLEYRLVADLVR